MAPFFDRPAALLLTECLPGWAVESGTSAAAAGDRFGWGGSTLLRDSVAVKRVRDPAGGIFREKRRCGGR